VVLISLVGCGGAGDETSGTSPEDIFVTPTISVIPQIVKTPPTIVTPTEAVSPTKHPLLLQHTLAPNNQPIAASTEVPMPPKPPTLQDDNLPDLVVSVGAQTFNGELEYTGPLSISNESIDIDPSGSDPITIQYRLPEQIGPIPSIRTGTVILIAETVPARSETRILLSDDLGLVFGQIRYSSESPIYVDLGSSVSLKQSSVIGVTDFALEVPVNLVDNGVSIAQIPINVPTTVKTSIGKIDIFVELSFYSEPDMRLTDRVTPYSLMAWIVRKER